MNQRQLHALTLRETDIEGAILRLGGNEAIYTQCLRAFLDDRSNEELNLAVGGSLWDDAFTAAHAVKGMAGNMGFVPLMHSTGQLIVIIRGGRLPDVPQALAQVNSAYRDIVDGIHQFFAYADENTKGDAK